MGRIGEAAAPVPVLLTSVGREELRGRRRGGKKRLHGSFIVAAVILSGGIAFFGVILEVVGFRGERKVGARSCGEPILWLN